MKTLIVASVAACVGFSVPALAQMKDPAQSSPLAARDTGQSSPLAKDPGQTSPLAKKDGGQESPLAKAPPAASDSPLATAKPGDSPLAKSDKK